MSSVFAGIYFRSVYRVATEAVEVCYLQYRMRREDGPYVNTMFILTQ